MKSTTSFTELREILGEENLLRGEPLSRHTTFRTGGPCDLLAYPKDEETLLLTISYLQSRKIPWFILGRGSNLLVSDSGYRGCAVSLKKHMNRIRVSGNGITAEAGAMLSETAREALLNSLSGLEFASGIPGTVGGGVFMNAGAYGGELKDVVTSVRMLLPDGQIRDFSNAEMDFSYRHSAAEALGGTIISARMELSPGDPGEIRALMDDLNRRRKEKQPLEFGSAGSTFKRPAGYYAGALIEGAGLKGYRVGGACVSEKHAGFVINLGNALAQDVFRVIRHTEEEVLKKSGVQLEREVRLLGDFTE